MKIEAYSVQQQAQSQYHLQERQTTEIQVERASVPGDQLLLSGEEPKTKEVSPFELSEEDRQKIKLLEAFVRALTGKKVRFSQFDETEEESESKKKRKKEIALNDAQLVGLRMSQKTERYEYESMQFQSKGVVQTSDGRTIDFSLNLSMSREHYELSESVLEAGFMQDPLVLNLDQPAMGFADKELRIDLDLDGSEESLRWLQSGSGFLALDKNHNGTIDDGSELFGPQSGDGFGELASYDDDNNGWIDENDAIFESLRIWTLDANNSEQLLALKDADVGAIYLGAVSSPYQLKAGGETVGEISASSIYLKESGEAGTVHNINYLV